LPRRALLVLFAVAFAAVAVRLAWVGDDAYITLRSVENWHRGHGLRWNVDERVQTYTHPLWMLVLSFGRLLTGEVYLTAITIGVLLSTATLAWLLWLGRTVVAVALVGACALTAHAFGDYATSGLETSLTYLLLVAFAVAVVGTPSPRRFFVAVLLASLLVCNRMDLALLCAPAVVAAMRTLSFRTVVGRALVGALPFAAWLAAATIYYGTPLPVTAHAKAFGLGIPAGDLAVQGLRYLWHAVVHDPVLVATLVAGFVVGLRERRWRWLAFGMPLYLLYVVKVGGDFMQGRFLLPPFVLALWLLANAPRLHPALLAVPLLGAVWAPPPWFSGPSADHVSTAPADIVAAHGIVDERRVYYPQQGLWSPVRDGVLEFGALNRLALAWPTERTTGWVLLSGAVGSSGFGAGSLGHLVDAMLCDPLLARLPAADPDNWRIGHVLRRIPEGYLESLATGENRIVHPGLRRYHEALRTVVEAPVFAPERWRAMWSLWRGAYDADLAAFVAEHYRTPPRVPVAAADVATALPTGGFWFDQPRVRLVYEGGLEVAFAAPVQCAALRVQLSGLCAFRFTFRRDGHDVGRAEATPGGHALEMQRLQDVELPVPATVGAFDRIRIDVVLLPHSDLMLTKPAVGAVLPR
jgi:arabinofuranosyltransferase